MKPTKRLTVFLIISLVLLICVSALLLPNSWLIKFKTEAVRNYLEKSFARQSELYAEITNDFLNSTESPYYNPGGTSHHVSEAMLAKIEHLQKGCAVDIDRVYITDGAHPEYPSNACVFSTTIERGDFVYAWVELVYSTDPMDRLFKDYREALTEGFVTELSDNWYIMIHYGY